MNALAGRAAFGIKLERSGTLETGGSNMTRRGIRLGIAISTTAILLSLNAAAVLSGRAEGAYEQLAELYRDTFKPWGEPANHAAHAATRTARCLEPDHSGTRNTLEFEPSRRATLVYYALNAAPAECATLAPQG